MEKNNSQVFIDLYCDLLRDVAELCSCPLTEVVRDEETILHRYDAEGISFLTKSLPQLGKALDRVLSSGEPISLPSHYGRVGSIPKLFRWYFRRVISADGFLLSEVDKDALRALRQLTYYHYKLAIPHSEEAAEKLVSEFVEVDESLPYEIESNWVLDEASAIIAAPLSQIDPLDIEPRHGPGAVATGEKVHEKHQFKRYYRSIHKVYPFEVYYMYGLSHLSDSLDWYKALEELETGTAKVVLVPKDSRGPRIISCEPLEYQWIQQGLGRAIVSQLERHWSTRGHVNFTDQTINRRLAMQSSTDQSMVTLDMKEASDRVSWALVKKLFAKVPVLLEALEATRTTHTRLPNGHIVRLKKFAPMGSNLCFPVESIVFYALAVAAIRHKYGISRREARRSVYVYGDDLIISRKYYPAVTAYMPTVGLMFNEAKCCTATPFRESCGCDAFAGTDVTPLRLKSVWGHSRTDASTIESYLGHSNMARARGYHRVASRCGKLVESVTGALPLTRERQGFLSHIDQRLCTSIVHNGKKRWNEMLQRLEYYVYATKPVHIWTDDEDWCMLLRRITSGGTEYLDLGQFAVPRRSRLYRGWSSLSLS